MSKVLSAYKSFRAWVAAQWWFAGFTACLGAFAGLLGSVYATQIGGAFPLSLSFAVNPVIWEAVLFWVSLFAFGLFFGMGFKAQLDATNKLEQAIRTLPPKGFLIAFEDLFRITFATDSESNLATSDLSSLTQTIVAALFGVVLLVRQFDTRNDHPSYSVNLMVFKPIKDIDSNELKKQIKFAEPGFDSDAWDGVLQLAPEFAYTVSGREAEPQQDKDVPPMMLPIPKPEYRSDNGKPTILPGAPNVFCNPDHRFAGFENTLQLATWCHDHSGLRPSIADDIKRYFTEGPGKEIRSFISIPVVSPNSTEVLGVLNMHSNRDGFLWGEQAELFVPLTTPFMLLISRALAKYILLQKQGTRVHNVLGH